MQGMTMCPWPSNYKMWVFPLVDRKQESVSDKTRGPVQDWCHPPGINTAIFAQISFIIHAQESIDFSVWLPHILEPWYYDAWFIHHSAILFADFSLNTASQYLVNILNLESETVWSSTLETKPALFSLFDIVLISDW